MMFALLPPAGVWLTDFGRSIRCCTAQLAAEYCTEHINLLCTICDFKSPWEKSLNIHIVRLHKGYQCDKCERKFTNSTSLRHHNKTHDNLECKSCEFIATRTSEIQEHAKAHNICEVCKRRFWHMNALNRHKRRHTELACNLCDFIAIDKRHLKNHIFAKHTIEKCYQCEFQGVNRQIMAHQKNRHMIRPTFSCIFCNFVSKQKIYLKTHVITQHTVTTCNICTFQGDRKQLKDHKKYSKRCKRGMKNKNTSTPNNVSLLKTEKKSDFSHKVECDTCLVPFSPFLFEAHTNSCFYCCPKCPYKTKTIFGLNNHLESHKEIEFSPENHLQIYNETENKEIELDQQIPLHANLHKYVAWQ